MTSTQRRVQRYIRQYEDRRLRKSRRRFLVLPVRLLFGLLFTAVGVYFTVQIYNAVNIPMQTVTALSTTVNDELSAVGYFVRAETVITENYTGILQYTAVDGDKLSKSEVYANVYSDASAAEITSEIQTLTARIQTLEAALAFANAESTESADAVGTENLAADIRSSLLEVNTIADSRGYSLMSDASDTLEELIINRDFAVGSVADVEATITQLKSRVTRLQNSIGTRESALYSPRASYFGRTVDGYEALLTPYFISRMTLDSYLALDTLEPEILPNVVGKVVTDFTWYFVTTLNPDDAACLTVGKYLYLQFDATGDLLVRAKVNDIRRQGDTDSLVIFESDRCIDSLISLRRQSARVILATYEGLKVPKEALRMDKEYNLGVYVITGMYAEFKPITPVYETKNYYIVKTDPSSTKSLLLYDEIILTARGLENKKVIA